MRRFVPALALLLVAVHAPAAHAQQNGFDLSIHNIMRGPELYGREPQNVHWSADGKYLYFQWNAPGTAWYEPLKPYRIRAQAGASPEALPESQQDSLAPLVADGDYSRDRMRKVVAWEGDLYLVEMRTGAVRRLTETGSFEGAATISADGRTVYYSRDNNVYSLDLSGGLLRQLTDIRQGAAPIDSARLGQRGGLQNTQQELFDVLRIRARLDSIARADRKYHEGLRPTPLYIATNERVVGLSISSSGRTLLVNTAIPSQGARETEVPQYVTSSGYTEPLRGRTKVGDAQSSGRVALVSLPSGTAKWLKLNPTDSTKPPSTALVLGWSPVAEQALVWTASPDYKARAVVRVDADGHLTTIDVLRDTAWVATGRGGSNLPCFTCGGWADNGARIYFTSEADGYNHLYTTDANGGDRRQLTKGKWEVTDVALSPDEKTFWLHASEAGPFDLHFYSLPVAGGSLTRLTNTSGMHQVTMSPDGQTMADVYSAANKPPELYIAKPGASSETQLTTSTTAEFRSYNWIAPAIVRVPASDGVQVPARIYRPEQFGAKANGAAVIFVHGAGYLHNVHNYWSSYSHEYMFNHLLASKGYVVIDVDYRGSGGYGRDWRTAIYRHMGGRDLGDEVDASKYLQKEFGIDPERIGIYGGSYGGFMTLMALFTAPKSFGAGAALRSVTDWAHYNHQYTAQILNTPQADSISYRQSSPIYFAQGLEDPLLMLHGMVDVNVHFQDIVRLTQRLIELGKTDWWLAPYPVEDHGFVRPDSWTDEYRRIYELFERTIGPNRLPNKGSFLGTSR
ncbi:MAG: putative dipeptidyl peptidase [Gemmatimonadetes bacterium]|nr:putative dipeptidyl peptidase [Gemmatimonadota bacterium]